MNHIEFIRKTKHTHTFTGTMCAFAGLVDIDSNKMFEYILKIKRGKDRDAILYEITERNNFFHGHGLMDICELVVYSSDTDDSISKELHRLFQNLLTSYIAGQLELNNGVYFVTEKIKEFISKDKRFEEYFNKLFVVTEEGNETMIIGISKYDIIRKNDWRYLYKCLIWM